VCWAAHDDYLAGGWSPLAGVRPVRYERDAPLLDWPQSDTHRGIRYYYLYYWVTDASGARHRVTSTLRRNPGEGEAWQVCLRP